MSRRVAPLAEVRVVELGTGIAGAYCTKLLADAGADVVKVEPPEGDPLRRWSAAAAGAGESWDGDGALFRFLYAGKRSAVCIPGDPAPLDDLLRRADVVIVQGDTVDEDWHVDRAHVRSCCERGVRITSFGTSGPWAGRIATEPTLQAWAGSMYTRGVPDREPLAAGGRTGEWIAGAFGALAALASRRGAPRWADVSVLEALVLTHTVFQPLAESMGQPRSQLSRNVEIPSIEPAKDGWVGFCTVQARVWHDFARMVGHAEWADDPSLRQWAGRALRIDELRGAIAAWLQDKTVDEVIDLASALRIAVAPVTDARTVLTVDHFVERGVFLDAAAGLSFPRPPYQLDALDSYVPRAAPLLGDPGGEPWRDRGARSAASSDPAGAAPSPLAGLRVADFTGAWAGSYCAQLVAQLGADVIKIESMRHPDPARMGTVKPGGDGWWEWAPIFHGVNTGKRAVTLDLDTNEGLELAAQIIKRSDVVLENFSPRVMDHWDLDWEGVRRINPTAIMVRMPGFGLSGPWRDRIGFAQTMEQASGMAAVTGYAGGQPIIPRGLCDPLGGLHAAIGLFIALADRDRTGRGQLVEASMIEAALNIAAEPIVEYSLTGTVLTRRGNRTPIAVPSGAYRAAGDDEWVMITVADAAQCCALRRVIGAPALADDRFDTAAGRRGAEDELDAAVALWCAGRDATDAAAVLDAAGVPAARVARPWEVHQNPQLVGRGFFETVYHPVIGRHSRYPGLPFRWDDEPVKWHRSSAPTLGQHNREVLGGLLGLSDADLEGLRAKRIIGERL